MGECLGGSFALGRDEGRDQVFVQIRHRNSAQFDRVRGNELVESFSHAGSRPPSASAASRTRFATQPAHRVFGLAGDLLPACASIRNTVKEQWMADL